MKTEDKKKTLEEVLAESNFGNIAIIASGLSKYIKGKKDGRVSHKKTK